MEVLNSKVVSLAAYAREVRDDRDRSQSDADEPLGERARLVDALHGQTAEYERIIAQVKSQRDSVVLSSKGTVKALFRFEKTLENLKLSLSNHRENTVRIENAALAGEAAAKVKALILDGHFDLEAVLVHSFSPGVIAEAVLESGNYLHEKV